MNRTTRHNVIAFTTALWLAPLAALQGIELSPGVKIDRTLVSWVMLDSTRQEGGSAPTIQRSDRFDAIVLGGKEGGNLMNGGDFLRRAQESQVADIKLLAWRDFEGKAVKNQAGHVTHRAVVGGARVKGGRPVLDGTGYLVAARTEADAKQATRHEAPRSKLIPDPTRPTYHLMSPKGNAHVADPNFAIFWKGRYHLFFICDGYAHVSSTDLIHWRWHPAMHGPVCSGGIFLNKDGMPTMITTSGWQNGKLVLFSALDNDLEKWSAPFPIEPKVRPGQDDSKMICWDPDAWVDGNTTYALQGVHPLIVGKEATLMKSTDLKTWEFVGSFMSREMPDVMRNTKVARKNEDVSCPNFFKLGDKWMLLCISHIRGCRYYLGDWKNEQFTPEFHGRMNWSLSEGMKDGDHGGEFFAPESLLTPDGRRVMWAWLFACSTKRISPTWHEVQSLPRELSLPKDGILRIKPLRELEQLRYSPASEKNIVVENGTSYRLKNISGDAVEIMATIEQGDVRSYGVKLLCDKANGKGIDIVVEPETKSIKLGSTTAPLELKRGEDIQLRIFVDRSIVEVFANDRQAVVKQHAYEPEDVGVCLFSEGGKMKVLEVKGWKMSASNSW